MGDAQQLLSDISDKWDDVYSIISELAEHDKLNLETKYSGLPSTLHHINTSTIQTIYFLSGVLKNESNISPQVLSRVGHYNNLHQQLEDLSQKISQCLDNLRPIKGTPNKASEANNSLQIEIPGKGNVNIADHVKQIDDALNKVVTTSCTLASILEYGPPSESEKYTQKLQELKKGAKDYLDSIEELYENIKSHEDDSKNTASTLNSLLDSSKQAKQQIDEINANSNEIKGELNTKADEVRRITGEAQALQSQITDYQSKFDAFDSQIDERNKQFDEFQKNTKELVEQRKSDKEEIDRITEKANEMIKGATVAGMASGLESTRLEYRNRLAWAGIFYFLSIVILFIVSGSIAAYAIPGFWLEWVIPDWALDTKSENVSSGWGFISRLVLLIPAFWLTSFTSKRYKALSELEQHYAFKSAMARSVEGFKKEAPHYQEEITALIFTDLRERPDTYNHVRHDQGATDRSRHAIADSMLSGLGEKIKDLIKTNSQ